jgi:hypothetical protein
MPEGRAGRAVEADAKSIDGAEPSARLEGVMAGRTLSGRSTAGRGCDPRRTRGYVRRSR